MMVPNKFTLQFCQFHMLAIEFSDNSGVPMILKLRKLFFHNDLFHTESFNGFLGNKWLPAVYKQLVIHDLRLRIKMTLDYGG